ncbi:hypothetical protein QYE76_023414 [Lolium multiflorum]|uniref:Aminotransferase-like plant mobile domain-containing protein n=1 Tax=Lolium multiflorum TaxID=4521 RepID=A0AAD8VS87_LOLMU|nr:hypothetical protein QYE76_023414 [Lolium multiflorum]
MNAAALTALVDRWRPETHTFHLRAGEMTPTLQDVSMILGLPIQGEPLCMNIASDGWRRQMEDLIGMAPPPPADPKDRTPAGAPFAWIMTHFGTGCVAPMGAAPHILPRQMGEQLSVEDATSAGRVAPLPGAPHSEVWRRREGRHTKGLDE